MVLFSFFSFVVENFQPTCQARFIKFFTNPRCIHLRSSSYRLVVLSAVAIPSLFQSQSRFQSHSLVVVCISPSLLFSNPLFQCLPQHVVFVDPKLPPNRNLLLVCFSQISRISNPSFEFRVPSFAVLAFPRFVSALQTSKLFDYRVNQSRHLLRLPPPLYQVTKTSKTFSIILCISTCV